MYLLMSDRLLFEMKRLRESWNIKFLKFEKSWIFTWDYFGECESSGRRTYFVRAKFCMIFYLQAESFYCSDLLLLTNWFLKFKWLAKAFTLVRDFIFYQAFSQDKDFLPYQGKVNIVIFLFPKSNFHRSNVNM